MFGSANTFDALDADSDLISTVKSAAATAPGEVVRVRPFKDTPGIGAAERFMRGLHQTDKGGGLPTYTFEAWFDERRVKFMVSTPDPDDVVDLVNTHYRNTSVQTTDERFLPIEPGDYIAVGRGELREDCIFPTKHTGSTPPLNVDPYSTLIPKLVGRDADRERVLLQVVFRPVSDSWYNRGAMGSDGDVIAESVKEGRVVGEINPRVVTSDSDKKKAKDMQAQRGKPAFQISVRIVAIADNPQSAVERAESVTGAFDEFDHDYADQGLKPVPLSGTDARTELERAASRSLQRKGRVARWLRGPDNVLTAGQLGAIAHFPNEKINVPDVDWSRMESGPGVPPDAPQLAGADDVDEAPAHGAEDDAGGVW